MIFCIYFVFLLLAGGQAQKVCPALQVGGNFWSMYLSQISTVTQSPEYDINEMKFYIMTPKSYPGYINPDGRPIDFKTLGCSNKKILINCHGWLETGKSKWIIDFNKAFIAEYNGCAVSVDYSRAAAHVDFVATARTNTRRISANLARYMLKNLADNSVKPRWDLGENFTLEDLGASENPHDQLELAKYLRRNEPYMKNIIMHGFSWGAHICGAAGYQAGRNGFLPAIMRASDPAGPFFRKLDLKQDATSLLSRNSAALVTAIRTSRIFGNGRSEWTHQTQYIGRCGALQDQCRNSAGGQDEDCDHPAAHKIMKWTMRKRTKVQLATQCSQCPFVYRNPNKISELKDAYCGNKTDSVGWQSRGIPGKFYINKFNDCIDI